MSRKKQITLVVFLGLIVFLAGGYLTLDWFQFLTGIVDHANPEIPYVRYTKVLSTALCFLIVLFIRKDGVEEGDTKRLFASFVFLLCADILFLFPWGNYFGIAFFAITNILLCVRHLHGAGKFAEKLGKAEFIKTGILKAVPILAVYGLFLIFVIYPLSGMNVLFIAILIYGLILSFSLWATLVAIQSGFLPRINAILAFTGILFLFVSDMAVGYHNVAPISPLRTIAIFSIWILYGSGIPLLALSGYNLEKLFTFRMQYPRCEE